MVQKVGGLTREEVGSLFQVFAGFESLEDIVQKVGAVEGLRSPIFHAMLRQEYLGIKRSEDPRAKEILPRFEAKFQALFGVLHRRLYGEQLKAGGVEVDFNAFGAVRMRPEDLAARVVSREDLAVAALTWLMSSARMKDVEARFGLKRENEHTFLQLQPAVYDSVLAEMFGASPPFESEFAPFAAALQARPETLRSHPESVHSILLYADPAKRQIFAAPIRNYVQIREGDAYDPLMATAGDALSPGLFPDASNLIPLQVMASRVDVPPDPLLLGCRCASIGDTVMLFVLPGFSRRDPAADRVLEVRVNNLEDVCSEAVKRAAPEAEPGQQPGKARAISMVLAYSHGELQRMIADMSLNRDDAKTVAKRSGQILLQDITKKVLAGEFDLDVAIQQVTSLYKQVAEVETPVYLSSDAGGDPRREMISISLVEALTQMKEGEHKKKAILAAFLANKCILMGEYGRAKAALTRAHSAIQAWNGGEEMAPILSMIHGSEASLSKAEGRTEVAIEQIKASLAYLHPAIAEFEKAGLGGVEHALNYNSHQNLLATLLSDAGRPGEALVIYGECRRMLERITAFLEVADFDNEEMKSYYKHSAKYGLGGVLANEGMLLKRSADLVRAASDLLPNMTLGDFIGAFDMVAGDGQERVRADIASTIDVLKSHICAAIPRETPLTLASREIRRHGFEQMKQALVISEETQGWNFGSIQARNCADFAEELGEPDETVSEYLGKAIEFGEVAQNLSELGALHGRAALLKERLGALEDAASHGAKAAAAMRSRAIAAAGTAAADHSRRGYRAAAEFLFDLQRRLGRPLDSVATAETAKSVFFAIEMQRGVPGGMPASKDSPLGERLQQMLALREQFSGALLETEGDTEAASSLQGPMEALDAEIASVRRQIASDDPRMGGWTRWSDIHDLSGPELNKYLGARSAAAIGAFRLGEDIQLYIASPSGCEVAPERMKRGEMAEFLGSLHRSMAAGRSLKDLRAAVRGRIPAFAWLEDRIEVHLTPQMRSLIVAPDDALYGFPFAMLCAGDKPAAASTPVVHAIGLDAILTSEPADGFEMPKAPLLAVSDPLAGTKDELPGAIEELKRITKTLGQSRVVALSGKQATISALEAKLPGCGLLHFACHGRAGGLGQNTAELWLAPGQGEAERTGILTPSEIVRRLDLRACALVNLSACELGRLQDRTGAGVDGIVSACLIAGADAVIASVTPLEDRAAAKFSGRFYEILTEGSAPDRALALTQAECWRGGLGQDMQAPKNWASYVVYCRSLPGQTQSRAAPVKKTWWGGAKR